MKPNSGALFKNEKKEDRHPDYRGKIFITPELAGKELEIAAWIKEAGPQSQNPGMKFMSLSVQLPYKKTQSTQGNTQSTQQNTPSQPDFDDPIPF